MIQLLRDREQDHRNWLAELEACVREHRSFGMARDPHQCKFGLWYAELIPEENIEPMPPALSGLNAGHHCCVSRRLKTHQTILLLSDEFFACSGAAN